jgi:biopolymer transport protein TolR
MNYSLSVCVLAFNLVIPFVQAQIPAMTKGVSVQMAKTVNASPMPEADNEDAWVVTITADGRLFFGTKLVTPEGLTEQMTATPRHRDQNLYIKADARTNFGNVENALKSAKIDGFEAPVLLTNQNETPSLGKLVAPKGLEVLVTSPPSDAVVVQLHNSGQPRPAVNVNDQGVAIQDLQTALNQALQGRTDRIVQLQADDSLPFAQVAQAIDLCSSVKAKVAIPGE